MITLFANAALSTRAHTCADRYTHTVHKPHLFGVCEAEVLLSQATACPSSQRVCSIGMFLCQCAWWLMGALDISILNEHLNCVLCEPQLKYFFKQALLCFWGVFPFPVVCYCIYVLVHVIALQD